MVRIKACVASSIESEISGTMEAITKMSILVTSECHGRSEVKACECAVNWCTDTRSIITHLVVSARAILRAEAKARRIETAITITLAMSVKPLCSTRNSICAIKVREITCDQTQCVTLCCSDTLRDVAACACMSCHYWNTPTIRCALPLNKSFYTP